MGERAWFVLEGASATGPLIELDLVQGYQRGRFSAATQVRREEGAQWVSMERAFDVAAFMPPPLPGEGDSAATDLSASSVDAAKWTTAPPRGWRRYVARQIDIIYLGLLMYWLGISILVVWSYAGYTALLAFSQETGGRLLLGLVITVLSLLLSALLLGVTGRTVGKLILGVKVLAPNGRPVGVAAAFKREFAVFLRGMGLGIPIVALITAIAAHGHLMKNGASSWDEDIGATVYYRKPTVVHFLLMAFGVALWIVTMIVLVRVGNATG